MSLKAQHTRTHKHTHTHTIRRVSRFARGTRLGHLRCVGIWMIFPSRKINEIYKI